MGIEIEISPGELIDRVTILEIKAEEITDAQKLANVSKELEITLAVRDRSLKPSNELDRLTAALKVVNHELWRVEDAIRDCEREQSFGPRFVELARSVYRQNDRRSEIKRAINRLLDSPIIEEKSYRPY